MTTPAQLRKVAASQPGVEESGTKAQPRYQVQGRTFAWLDEDRVLHLRLDAGTAEDMVAQNDAATHTDEGIGIPIADMSGQAIHYWVSEAWKGVAPAAEVARMEAVAHAEPGEVGDLPASIGRPATRALVGADITTLSQVAAATDDELLALHGMGPKAVRLLRQAIASR